jgi:hypothetical protein
MTENIYHRYLDIPISPNIDLFARDGYDPNQICHIGIDESELNPALVEWLDTYNVGYYFVEAFYTPPNGGKIHIHTDTATVCNVVKINWTYGAPGGRIVWWQPEHEDKIESKQTGFDATYLTTEEQYCKKLFEADTNKPSLVNVGLFHSTWNPSNEGRWTLSLPLINKTTGERISWDDANKLFRDIIISVV